MYNCIIQFGISVNYYVFDFVSDKNSSIDLKSNITSILETLEFKNFNITEQ